MTISSSNRKAGPFIGTGAAATFSFAFKLFTADDLEVVLAKTVAGTETQLVLESDFTASLNADQDSHPGGSITLTAGPLAADSSLVISSSIDELQETDITNMGGFYPEVITNALDKLTILVQQLQEQVNCCFKLSISDSVSSDLPAAAMRAGKFLSFGADGSPSLIQLTPSGVSLFSGALSGSQNGVNRVFQYTNNGSPLGKTPIQAVVWKNYPLVIGVGYVAGPGIDQITFTNAPKPTDTLWAQGSF